MVHPELVTYITEQSKEGMSADALRQELLAAGWRELDIDNALHDVAAGMAPISIDASLHEDLAQVRGMVAHLATRLRAVEVRLTGAPALELPAQKQLPAPVQRSWLGQWLVPVVAVAGFAVLTVLRNRLIGWGGLAPADQAIINVVVGLALFIGAAVAARIHWSRTAAIVGGVSIAIWGVTARVAWQTYRVMEWSTAAGIALLLIVLAFVFGRWVHRSTQ